MTHEIDYDRFRIGITPLSSGDGKFRIGITPLSSGDGKFRTWTARFLPVEKSSSLHGYGQSEASAITDLFRATRDHCVAFPPDPALSGCEVCGGPLRAGEGDGNTCGPCTEAGDEDPRPDGILLTREQLRAWAGLDRDLTQDELDRLEECIPNSSIPDAIGTIVSEALGLDDEDDDDGPDLFDGYVTSGSAPGGRIDYQVRLGGIERGTFPTSDIAVYELARAMAVTGSFPAAWMEGEHGPSSRSIDDEVRRWHDLGGTVLLPLPGVLYTRGDRVLIAGDGMTYVVDGDYGVLGVMVHADGDPSVSVVAPHAQLMPYPESCAHCGLPVIRQDTGIWEDPDYTAGSDTARYCDASPDHRHHWEG